MVSMEVLLLLLQTLYETAVLGGDGSTAFSGAANTNTGNGTALTDASYP